MSCDECGKVDLDWSNSWTSYGRTPDLNSKGLPKSYCDECWRKLYGALPGEEHELEQNSLSED